MKILRWGKYIEDTDTFRFVGFSLCCTAVCCCQTGLLCSRWGAVDQSRLIYQLNILAIFFCCGSTFFVCSETQTTIFVANFSFMNQNEERAFGAAMAIFPLTNKSKYKHADYLYTYHWKTTTNELNASHIRSLVWLPNVSSQLYTLFFLYLLEKNCTRLKNCRLVLCSIFNMVFPFAFWRRSTDRHVARTRPQLCSISCSSPLNPCWVQHWVLHSRLMTHIT